MILVPVPWAIRPASGMVPGSRAPAELVRENRHRLLDLMAQDTLVPTKQEWLSACDFTEQQFEDLWSRILAGERPFEEWMHAHGRSDEEIAEVYRVIDEWLMRQGIIHPPEFGTTLH